MLWFWFNLYWSYKGNWVATDHQSASNLCKKPSAPEQSLLRSSCNVTDSCLRALHHCTPLLTRINSVLLYCGRWSLIQKVGVFTLIHDPMSPIPAVNKYSNIKARLLQEFTLSAANRTAHLLDKQDMKLTQLTLEADLFFSSTSTRIATVHSSAHAKPRGRILLLPRLVWQSCPQVFISLILQAKKLTSRLLSVQAVTENSNTVSMLYVLDHALNTHFLVDSGAEVSLQPPGRRDRDQQSHRFSWHFNIVDTPVSFGPISSVPMPSSSTSKASVSSGGSCQPGGQTWS